MTPLLLAALAGCGGASAADEVRFDGERAFAHLRRIVALGERPSGSGAIEELRLLLEEELRSLGLDPLRETFRARTPKGEIEFANVYADIPGRSAEGEPPPILVFATHFDTKAGLPFEFVGANDGGSGTAALLELARCLTAREPGPVTWRLLFLDGEESVRPYWMGTDNRYGSRHHVAELRRSGELERVGACVLLDMVGDRELCLTTELLSDPRLLQLVFAAARAAGLGHHVGCTPREIQDDHLSFLEAGVPAVNLIDFEYGPDNAYWHSPEDTLEHCSPESLDAIGHIVLTALPGLEAFVQRTAR